MAPKKKSASVASANNNIKDILPKGQQSEYLEKKLDSLFVRPDLTENQKNILNTILDKKVKAVSIDGPPGVGKSYISILGALSLMNNKRAAQLVYIRSLIQAKDGETGFLTGDLNEKTFYYNHPLYDTLGEIISENDIAYLKKDSRLLTYPTSMLRSYNFHNSVIIAEEAQNMSWDSLYTVATRAGNYSKTLIIGDSINQNDLGNKSGFKKFVNIFDDEESKQFGIHYFKITSDDIVRSPFVKFIVQKIERYNEESQASGWTPGKK